MRVYKANTKSQPAKLRASARTINREGRNGIIMPWRKSRRTISGRWKLCDRYEFRRPRSNERDTSGGPSVGVVTICYRFPFPPYRPFFFLNRPTCLRGRGGALYFLRFFDEHVCTREFRRIPFCFGCVLRASHSCIVLDNSCRRNSDIFNYDISTVITRPRIRRRYNTCPPSFKHVDIRCS